MIVHLKHFKHYCVGRTVDVLSCTGGEPFDNGLIKPENRLTEDIDKVTCRECFYIWHHPKMKCCGEK